MGWWSWLTGAGATPNATVSVPDSVGPTYRPGDPNGVEITDEVADGPQSRVHQQVANGVAVRMAVLDALLG